MAYKPVSFVAIALFVFNYLIPVTLLAQNLNRPNIVLIVADDHGTDAMGCYGNKVIKTPNLDRLASDGVRFNNAFCTSASCSPSRSVLLTGLHNHSNGMYGLQHDFHHFESFENIKSLPVILADDGYLTARIGKYHLAPESVYKFQQILSEGAANDPKTLGRSPVEMAERCAKFINESKKPFFLYFASDDPHRANGVLPNGLPTFDSYPEPNSFGNRKESYPGIKEVTYTPEQVIVPNFLPDNKSTRAEIAQYYQAVSRLDQGVGKLIQVLKETGKYDNTLIIYLSDNGVAFPGAKTTLYDPGMKLPLIVKEPVIVHKNETRDALISWVDIVPTILDYAHVNTKPQSFAGQSFKKILDNANDPGQSEIFASHSFHEVTMYYPMRVVRTHQYKLIYNIANNLTYPLALDLVESSAWQSIASSNSKFFGARSVRSFLHRPKFELYDIQKDPNEINNLAYKSKYKGVLMELTEKLKKFQSNTNDPWFYKWKFE